MLVGARKECPLIVGRGDGEQFLASGIPAFLAHTRTVQALEDDELVVLTADGARVHDRRRRRVRARDPGDRLGRRRRREGRLRDLHAQGDPRAGRRRRRDDRRPHRAPGRRGPPRARRRAAARRQAHHHRRLRHLLPRGPDRPLRDRGVGARPGRDGRRLRVPLPQPGGRPRRPRDRHHAVRRVAGHAGRDAPRPRARRDRAGGDQHHGLAGHARRRTRPSTRAPAWRSASPRPRRSSPRSP